MSPGALTVTADSADDVTATIVGLARTLRAAGVPAGPDRVQAMLAALDHLDGAVRDDVYWAGRLTLCGGPDDLDRYDRAFAAYFAGQQAPARRSVRAVEVVRPLAVPAPATGDTAPGRDAVPAATASEIEVLRHRDLAALTAAERELVHQLIAQIDPVGEPRPSRRHRRSHRGEVDAHRTVTAMLRRGGEPVRLARRTRRERPRRLVLVVDVSGSMQPYADPMLRFAHAAARRRPGTEVFTLGTRLTRVTREIRGRDPSAALLAVAGSVPDWSGGTRLGELLKAFLDRWGQRGVARGAVVVVASDGWERGDATLLGEQMARLHRLAYRVVWANPHRGQPGYVPMTAGMLAALPYVDEFVDGHSLAALERLADVVSGREEAMRDVLDEISQWYGDGARFAVATVVSTWRSAPRQPGAAMAVLPGADPVGSVSGGCVEGAVFDLAQEVLAPDGEPTLVRYGVSDDDAFAVGLTCGGIIDIFVEPVDAATFPDLPAVAASVRAHETVAVATVVDGPGEIGAHLVIWPDRTLGSLGRERLDAAVTDDGRGMLDHGSTGFLRIGPDGQRRQDELSIFVQSFAPPPRMLIFGAIDFAAAMARVGKLLGYHVTVCDARGVFATEKRFPVADEVVVEWPHRFLETVQVDSRTVICVLTHDPKFDVPLLEAALQTDAAYIGAMGSRRTHDDRLARLRAEGVDEESLARVSSPIGLDIGARTPEETAVSIAAEIVAGRWGGSGRRLTETEGPIHGPHEDLPQP